MVFMFEERVHITTCCLTSDIHSWKKAQATLHVVYFVFRLCCGRFFPFTSSPHINNWRLFFLILSLNGLSILRRCDSQKSHTVPFPCMASALIIFVIALSDIFTFVSSAKRLSLVSVNCLPNSLKTSIILCTFVANLYSRQNLFMMFITTWWRLQ